MAHHYDIVGVPLPTEQTSTEPPSVQPADTSLSTVPYENLGPDSSLPSDPPPSQEPCIPRIPVAPAPPSKVYKEVTKGRKKNKKKKKRPQSSERDQSGGVERKDESKKVHSTSDQEKGLKMQEPKTREMGSEVICGCKKIVFVVLTSICSCVSLLIIAVIIFCLVQAYTADGIWPSLGAGLRLIFNNTTKI